MVTSVTKGRTQKLPKQFNIIETYRHDLSLESSWAWEALSDGTIISSIQPFSREKCIFWIFLKKPLSLKSLIIVKRGSPRRGQWSIFEKWRSWVSDRVTEFPALDNLTKPNWEPHPLTEFFWVPGVFSRDENSLRQKSWKYHLAMFLKAY
jgi:hypothetical protein